MTTNVTPQLIDVKIQPWSDSCGNKGISVHPVWSNVDRPDCGGWVVTNARVAARLAAALRDGKIYRSVTIATDINGQTYANTEGSAVRARAMNADLKRIGY